MRNFQYRYIFAINKKENPSTLIIKESRFEKVKYTVYNCDLVYDNLEAVWTLEGISTIFSSFRTIKNSLCIFCNEAKLMILPYRKFRSNENYAILQIFAYRCN